MISGMYYRYGSKCIEKDYKDVEEAIRELERGAEWGELFQMGVYDDTTSTIYIPDCEPYIRRYVKELTIHFKLSNPFVMLYNYDHDEAKVIGMRRCHNPA